MIIKTFSNRRGDQQHQHHRTTTSNRPASYNDDFTRRGGAILDEHNSSDNHKQDDSDPDEKLKKLQKRPWCWRINLHYPRWFQLSPQSNHERRLVPSLIAAILTVLLLVLSHQVLVWLVGKPPLIPLVEFPEVDFVVGGFPKCGTTTLLFTLRRHNPNELRIPSRESCALKDTWRPTYRIRQRYRSEVLDLIDSEANGEHGRNQSNAQNNHYPEKRLDHRNHTGRIVTGLKCPTAIHSHNYMYRINEINQHHARQHGSNTIDPRPVKWVIGIRQPIWQVQSFYNYRITELYDKKKWWKDIRSLQDIMFSTVPWKDMSSSTHQYQHYLMDMLHFLETNLTSTTQATTRGRRDERSPQIFLYIMEQIQDDNAERTLSFRRDLSNFLGLKHTLGPLGRENVNKFVTGPDRYKETIDICHQDFREVRQKILQDSIETANWIQQYILQTRTDGTESAAAGSFDIAKLAIPPSEAIFASNRTFVHASLEKWKVDPCLTNHE